jgi:hypothetical protein
VCVCVGGGVCFRSFCIINKTGQNTAAMVHSPFALTLRKSAKFRLQWQGF